MRCVSVDIPHYIVVAIVAVIVGMYVGAVVDHTYWTNFLGVTMYSTTSGIRRNLPFLPSCPQPGQEGSQSAETRPKRCRRAPCSQGLSSAYLRP